MPDQDPLTPSSETVPESLTSNDGIVVDGQSGADSAATSESVTDWEERYKASSREVNRIREEQNRLAAENAQYRNWVTQMQQQAAYQPPQQTSHAPQQTQGADPEGLTPEEAEAYSNALILGNRDEIARYSKLQSSRARDAAKRDIYTELVGTARVAQKQMAAQQYIGQFSQQLADQNNPLTQRAAQFYQWLANDQTRSYESAEMRVGSVTLNPHILRDAIERANLELNASSRQATEAARLQGETFLEPGNRSAVKTSDGKFNAQVHLSDAERTAARDIGQSYDDYWKYMEPGMKAARLKAGKSLNKYQI